MNKLIAALALLALTGCATCREHPLACAVAGVVVAGCALAFHRIDMTKAHDYTVRPVNCDGGACK